VVNIRSWSAELTGVSQERLLCGSEKTNGEVEAAAEHRKAYSENVRGPGRMRKFLGDGDGSWHHQGCVGFVSCEWYVVWVVFVY
jgi:hypothetical protein